MVRADVFLRISCDIPKSLQILLAKKLFTSLCLGTVEVFLNAGLKNTEWLAPSLIKIHPFLRI